MRIDCTASKRQRWRAIWPSGTARTIVRSRTRWGAGPPWQQPDLLLVARGLTATKLIQDLEETENLGAMYRQAGRLTSDAIRRGRLEGLATDEAHGSQTIRAILVRMYSYVTDRP